MRSKPLVVANWKATKTIKDTMEWVRVAKDELVKIDNADVVVCAPTTSLPFLKPLFENKNVKLGAQEVSKFRKGAYTGETTVEMLDGLVNYCIVGHSERRKYLAETDDDVIDKVEALLEFEITPILCVSDLKQLDSYVQRGKVIGENTEKIVFVYEPPSAISGGGTYRPDSPEDVSRNANEIGAKLGKRVTTLYGGSINPENVQSFFSLDTIDGGLVGQASTDPRVFLEIFTKIQSNN